MNIGMETAKPVYNDQPLFTVIFGDDWSALPSVFHKHYATKPYTHDTITVKGHLDVYVSKFVSVLARLTGALVPYSGERVPVTVTFSAQGKNAFHFIRTFHYPDKGDVQFTSRMEPAGGNEMIEFMKFGIGWRNAYRWDGEKIVLQHRGYVWRIFGATIPIPLHWVLGRGHAEETAIDATRFAMWTHCHHPLFGKSFGYAGQFEVVE